MLRRSDPDATPAAVFTDLEIEFLDASCPKPGTPANVPSTST